MDTFLIYFGCFSLGLIFTLLSALFGGHDSGDLGTQGHAEAGFDHSGVPGISPFSPTTILSFITAFGGFGMIFSKISVTSSPWVSIPLAALGGVGVAAGVMTLFGFVFSKTQSSSESRVATLKGKVATVITPIPAGGVGEIAYVEKGTRYTSPARLEDGEDPAEVVSNGQTVKISRVVGSQYYVTRA
jgi:membrane protein implicated in regulation of membrane protease activity